MKCRFEKIADGIEQIADRKKPNPVRNFISWGYSTSGKTSNGVNAICYTLYAKPAFSLIEVMAAVGILAIICSSVLTVYSRCMASAVDSTLRRQAFEVARENMEELLASDSVTEMVEFGSSDRFGEIQWQRTVETFYEPITARMWVRAICSAEYTDAAGSAQTVELTNWLTNVTKQQLLQIIEDRQKQQDRLAEQDKDEPEPDEPEPDEPEPDEPEPDEPEPDEPEPDEPEPKPDTENPLGLPDGYEDWSIDEIIEWLRGTGQL